MEYLCHCSPLLLQVSEKPSEIFVLSVWIEFRLCVYEREREREKKRAGEKNSKHCTSVDISDFLKTHVTKTEEN